MSDPFIGEIKVISFNYPPRGWAFCNGQTLPINQNQALFSILGTMYGGDGRTTFQLPDFQGRMPVHQGSGYSTGERGGEAAHTLSLAEMPRHTHQVGASSSAAATGNPDSAVWATSSIPMFAANPDTLMSAGAVGSAGSSQPHENQAPFLVLNFVIALVGIFPSRN